MPSGKISSGNDVACVKELRALKDGGNLVTVSQMMRWRLLQDLQPKCEVDLF